MNRQASETPATCSKCGSPVGGAFCSSCGTPVASGCGACGSDLEADARFCHVCGAPQARRTGTGVPKLPWALAGGAVVLLVLVLAVRPESAPTGPSAGPPGTAATGAGPDLSNLTARQQADMLFDRVMMAAERGDSAEIERFAAKTVQAYGLLGSVDEDARYHVALIEVLLGNTAAASAQADSIEAAVPRHLFASLIRHRVAEALNDSAGQRRAARQFLENYEPEGALARPEYAAHQRTLESFRETARRTTDAAGGG